MYCAKRWRGRKIHSCLGSGHFTKGQGEEDMLAAAGRREQEEEEGDRGRGGEEDGWQEVNFHPLYSATPPYFFPKLSGFSI